MKYVKMFGIQRTGTNFVQQLMRQNYKNVQVFDNQFGWKHDVPMSLEAVNVWMSGKKSRLNYRNILEDITNGNYMYPCIVIKNPYSWHQSIKKWQRNKFNLEKSYKRFNYLYRTYKEFCESGYKNTGVYNKGVVIQYEDVLRNTEESISKISKLFSIEMKKNFSIPNKVPQSSQFTKERKEFYLSAGNFGLSDKLIKEITGLVNWDLMKFYGYKPKR